MKVFFTIDTEIWPGGWDSLDERFPAAFLRYVYGETPQGSYGLPMQLKVFADCGLKAVFFVEPLFSARFGLEPLQEVVGLIRDAGQDVQMHLHAEWTDEALEPLLLERPTSKRQHLSYYSASEQDALIRWGKARLAAAGAGTVSAFRAGSFAFNLDTLKALTLNGISVDSSYNHCNMGAESGFLGLVPKGTVPNHPIDLRELCEFPVTVFEDRPGHLRPLQITACSLKEMQSVLYRAAEREYSCVVLVSHNFELLDRRDFSRDKVVVRRFMQLCDFLSRNSDAFETASFAGDTPPGFPALALMQQPCPVRGSMPGFVTRVVEQALRRI